MTPPVPPVTHHRLGTLLLFAFGLTLAVPTALALDTQLVKSGFTKPLYLTAPDGDSRLFVVEQDGRIQVRSGGVWSTFLDIRGQVNAEGERGLLGLAFDPNYAVKGAPGFGTFYVDYIDKTTLNTKIARFTVTSNPNVANTNGTPIMTITQPPGLNNHKGGWIGFRRGDSNNLYIATGDGGGSNDLRLIDDPAHPGMKIPDPNFDNNAQNTQRLLGKILRINVHGDAFPNDPNKNYALPGGGNRLANLGLGAPEVFDYGLRNPYRDSFDRATGNFLIADVGQDAREEIDFESGADPGGNNYGWRLREGTIATPGGVGGPPPAGAHEPVYDYLHGTGTFQGESVIGGYVYRGNLLRALLGDYVFGDFISGQVWAMETDPATGAPLPGTRRDLTHELKRLHAFGSISSFGEDAAGNLYIIDYARGQVLEIVPEPSTYAMVLLGFALLVWWRTQQTRMRPSAC